MAGYVEEVGARLNLAGRRAFQTGLKEAQASVKDFAASTVKSNEQMAAATKAVADAQTEAAAKIQAAAAATSKAALARKAAVEAAATGDREATLAAKAEADALSDLAIAANREASAARASVSAAKMQTAALKSNSTATALAAKSASRHSTMLGKLQKASRALVLGGLGASAVAAYEGSKAFASYQQALEAVHTQAGLTQARVNSLGKSILSLTGSGKIPVGPTDMANILYRVASSTAGMGYSNSKLMSMVRAAAQLAVIGGPGTDVEQTARIVGGIRATGVKGAGSPRNIVALANATVGSGDLRMSDFVNFIGTGVLSSAKLAGVTLPQVAGMLALLGDNLQSGSTSGRSIAHALQLLEAPSSVGMNAYRAIGLPGTQIGNLMRTKGLSAAIGDLKKHLMARGSINPNRVIGHGMSAESESQWLQSYGWSPSQVLKAARVGLGSMGNTGKTLMDMLLTRMFGGAKQAIPIETIITQQGRYNRKVAQSKQQMGNFPDAWKKTMAEDANELKAFEVQLQTLGVKIGSWVLPKAIAFGHWLERNWTDIKHVAEGLSTLLVPAVAVYAGFLVNKGVAAMRDFSGWLRNTRVATAGVNTELGGMGTAAESQVGGLGRLGQAVMGVTAAIGVFELGRATGSHGTGGAVTAGLGGAVTGAIVGLSIGGPFGAAVGGAGGALVGLAGHFWQVATAAKAAAEKVSVATQQVEAMTGQVRAAIAQDKKLGGASTMMQIQGWESSHPKTFLSMEQHGVRNSDLIAYAKGHPTKALNAYIHWATTPGNAVKAGLVGLPGQYSGTQGLIKYLNRELDALRLAGHGEGGYIKGLQINKHKPAARPTVTHRHVGAGGTSSSGTSHSPTLADVLTGKTTNVHITQHFHGPTDPKTAYEATKRGVQDALARS